ncbi:MAG TPA: ABC transporter permease, partial [Rhodothermia bacterium]
MLRNHIKIFWRHIRRQPTFAFINVFGLAVGLAACMLIALFVEDELSYEDMHSQSDRIYRVLTIDRALGTNNQRVGISMPALGPALTPAFPEIEDAVRVTFGGQTLLRYEDGEPIYAEELRNADPTFFEFFDYRLISGDPETALAEPFALILTESLAGKLFGGEDPMGRTVRNGNGVDFTITGVLEDLPVNTHMTFDALGSYKTLEAQARANQPEGSTGPIFWETWQAIAMPTYAKFAPGTSAQGFDERLTKFVRDNGVAENFSVTLQPLEDVHLGSTDVIFDPVQNKGDANTVYVFAAIAVLILLIAVVNYLNLSTARSAERAREVGLRKVVGSTKRQLVSQFLSESVFTAFTALVIALGIAWAAVPALNSLSGASVTFGSSNLELVAGFVLVSVLVVGLLGGLYPAFALSGFNPISVLKGKFQASRQGRYVRIGLVIFQFALSIALIGTTWMVQKQLRFIQSKDMGYDREQVMLFDMVDQAMASEQQRFVDELKAHSAFSSVAPSGNVPGRTFGRTGVTPEGAAENDIWIWSVLNVAPETLPALGIEMAAGRNFERDRPSDESGVILINETAVRQLGWDDPLQRRIYLGAQDTVGSHVIGVVKDFHFAGIHQHVEPLLIGPLGTNPGFTIVARAESGRVAEAVKAAEVAWAATYPDYPFKYGFLDQEFEQTYERDQVTGTVINVFSILAIVIACLGLFGLASYSTSQRTKEIGVRKVMGASAPSITRLLVFDFVRWVLLANLLAWPLAWLASNHWLETFAYRVDVDPLVLLGGSIAGLAIAIVTVLAQT